MSTPDLTERAVVWRHTGDGEFPYAAEVEGRSFTIRINDFPAEPLYTLLSEGSELQDLEDWPPAWVMPGPPKELLDRLAKKIGPRLDGAIRLAATSDMGEMTEALAVDGDEVVAGSSRRLDLATLEERPPKPLPSAAHGEISLENGERVVAREQGLAVTSFESAEGFAVRVHAIGKGHVRGLAVGQPQTLAASISPNGKAAVVLDVEGRVLCYDLTTRAYPSTARTRKPVPNRRASMNLARDGRLWLVSLGTSIEVRMMSDAKPVATVELSPLGGEVTCAIFTPDGSGLLAGTANGTVMRFELLLDRVGTSRAERIVAIADAVDAAIAGGQWERYAPRIDVYDERTEGGRTTLYFVADHYEYHQAQSGSDWAEHDLCSGHATFEGDRRIDVEVASLDRRNLTERQDETYDPSAELAARRAAAERARSS